MTDKPQRVNRLGLLCEQSVDGRPCGQPAAILDPTRGMIALCADHRELPDEEAVLLVVRRSEAEGSAFDG